MSDNNSNDANSSKDNSGFNPEMGYRGGFNPNFNPGI